MNEPIYRAYLHIPPDADQHCRLGDKVEWQYNNIVCAPIVVWMGHGTADIRIVIVNANRTNRTATLNASSGSLVSSVSMVGAKNFLPLPSIVPTPS
ncbi:hypothetical protein [Chloroflexus sp. Y-396-1]|uniref:hypothetical protein n=1 Tax=Chloroflexus sp. Y-396-1 TaxID=867845 RepID=UPI0012EBC27C|nr:hypothetical protein [Chloroflexus sp. Y-396-1]